MHSEPMLTIQVTPPDGYSPAEPIFLAGTISGWQPDDERFRLTFDDVLRAFVLRLAQPPHELQYKFTRGSWETEEVRRDGQPMANRLWVNGQHEAVFSAHIENWRDSIRQQEGQVYCWQEALWMPQLNRHRRVWVYLPPNYDRETRRYPVLYMHDAQNLFVQAPTSFETWRVDQTLDQLFAQTNWACIVIGIEHGDDHRLAEYSPVPNPEHGGGEGQAYLRFLTETLKPLVDEQFRTLPDAAHTAMIGSSMGGLISVYAALQYGDVFGKVAAFSPSLWWSDDVYRIAAAMPYNFVHTLVLLGGKPESETMLPDLLALYYTLVDNGYFEHKIQLDFYRDGSHAEWFWGRELERAVRWLFSDEIAPVPEMPFVEVEESTRQIRLLQPFLKAALLNGYGKEIYSLDGAEGQLIPLRPHWRGLYALQCTLPNQRIELKKIIL